MKTTILLLLLLLHLTAQAAVPVGGVRINSDTTGTNTRSAAVTVTLQTNLNSGVVNATNSVRVGQAGEAGVVQISSTTSTNFFTLTTTSTNALVSINATDDFDHAALTIIVTNEVSSADLLHLQNGTNVMVYIQASGSLLARTLWAEDSPASDNFTRIQPTDFKINAGTNTNYFEVHLSNGEINWLHEGTNAFKVVQDSGYLGGGTLALTDDGTYKAFGTSSLTINPTDGYLPYRSSSTAFSDSPFYRIGADALGINATNWMLVINPTNTFAGSRTSYAVTTSAIRDTSYGKDALNALTTGTDNTGIGDGALSALTTANNSTAVGAGAGRTATGRDNVFVGTSAGANNTTGTDNTALGRNAGNTSGSSFSRGVAVGRSAGSINLGSDSVEIGYQSGITVTNHQRAIDIGTYIKATGERSDRDWSDTIRIGYKSGSVTNNTQVTTNSIYIGSELTPDASNEIVIGNTNQTKAFFAITSYTDAGTRFLQDAGVYSINPRYEHAALTAHSATTNYVANFTEQPYRTITAANDVNMVHSTNRAAVYNTVIFITPSGANRNLTVNSSWKKLNTFNTVVTNGTTGVLSLTVSGTAETDVYATYAVTQ